ncbi:unnamed protein product [Arctogadus glacialis]
MGIQVGGQRSEPVLWPGHMGLQVRGQSPSSGRGTWGSRWEVRGATLREAAGGSQLQLMTGRETHQNYIPVLEEKATGLQPVDQTRVQEREKRRTDKSLHAAISDQAAAATLACHGFHTPFIRRASDGQGPGLVRRGEQSGMENPGYRGRPVERLTPEGHTQGLLKSGPHRSDRQERGAA